MTSNGQGPLLSQRATLVLLLGVLVGIGTGVLTAKDGQSAWSAITAGGAAFLASVAFFHSIID